MDMYNTYTGRRCSGRPYSWKWRTDGGHINSATRSSSTSSSRVVSSPVNLVALFVTCRLRRITVDTQIIFTFTIAIKIILIFRFERSYKLTVRWINILESIRVVYKSMESLEFWTFSNDNWHNGIIR